MKAYRVSKYFNMSSDICSEYAQSREQSSRKIKASGYVKEGNKRNIKKKKDRKKETAQVKHIFLKS